MEGRGVSRLFDALERPCRVLSYPFAAFCGSVRKVIGSGVRRRGCVCGGGSLYEVWRVMRGDGRMGACTGYLS